MENKELKDVFSTLMFCMLLLIFLFWTYNKDKNKQIWIDQNGGWLCTIAELKEVKPSKGSDLLIYEYSFKDKIYTGYTYSADYFDDQNELYVKFGKRMPEKSIPVKSCDEIPENKENFSDK